MSFRTLINSLTRTTSSGRLIPALDGLRCVAILAVILHHLGGYVAQRTPGLDYTATKQTAMYKLIDIGNCGVQLFFVISGFIVALPFAEHYLCGGRPVLLGKYFWRRIIRLHPPYLVNLFALFVLLVLVKHESWSELAPHLVASIFYLHNAVFHSMSTVNGVAWSLEIEVQFYLLVPWLTLVYRIPNPVMRRGLLLTVVAVVMLAKTWAGTGVAYPLSGCVLYYLDYFCCGLLLADWHTLASPTDKSTSPRGGLWWDTLGLFSTVGCLLLPLNSDTWHLLPIALLPACVASLRGPRLNWILSRRLFVVVGGMCYTIYLYHFVVISLIGRRLIPLTAGWSYPAALGLQMALILPAILAISAALFWLIEKPFMTILVVNRRTPEMTAQPA